MLFSIDTKESISDLFHRKAEIKELEEALRLKEKLTVIYGVRRTGKTSLIKAVLNEKEWPYVFIDIREIYLKYNSVPIEALAALVIKEFTAFLNKLGFDLYEQDENDLEEGGITGALRYINAWCKDKKLNFVIALDEAQYLRFSGSVKYDMLLAWSMDNLSNIIFVLSGSEIGTLKEFLDYENVNAALYGRFRNDIYLKRFSKEQSKEYLEKGFAEFGRKLGYNEAKNVEEKLDGTVGWLSYYGYYRCVKKMDHTKALDKLFEEGYALTKDELEKLIKNSSKRYLLILKAVASGSNKWSEIKPYVVAKSGKTIKDGLLSNLLQNLVKFGVIEKDELRKEYRIEDPLIMYTVTKMKL